MVCVFEQLAGWCSVCWANFVSTNGRGRTRLWGGEAGRGLEEAKEGGLKVHQAETPVLFELQRVISS